MKLYAKEKVFSFKDRFRFFNELDEDVLFVEGKLWSFTKKLTMTDPAGNEVAIIKEEFWSWLPRFYVYINGEQIATIKKQFTFLRPKYSIECKGWNIDGDFWDHNYTITCGDQQIASVHKQWLSWGDSYEIDIADPADAVLVASIVLCIDCVQEKQAAASSSSASSSSASSN
ncbi:MAG: LURP-one-related family protein [Oscillospiraceae bacterium]|nr:LURP-one-related family protein [Oscillospiraceae bacterium]